MEEPLATASLVKPTKAAAKAAINKTVSPILQGINRVVTKVVDPLSKAVDAVYTDKTSQSRYDYRSKYNDDGSYYATPFQGPYSIDFSGRARIIAHYKELDIDLVLTGMTMTLADHLQVEAHQGDTYSTLTFGKSPAQVRCTGVLPETPDNFGRVNLANAYKNILRMYAVSRTGEVPVLRVKGIDIYGPWTSMSLTDRSASEDTVDVTFAIAVTKIQAVGDTNFVMADYENGEHLEAFGVSSSVTDKLPKGADFIKTVWPK